MCGFAGFLTRGAGTLGSLEAIATHMAKAIYGPVDLGAWADADAGIALGFVAFPSLTCRPPGTSRWLQAVAAQIAFNWEIYNHLETRAKLQEV